MMQTIMVANRNGTVRTPDGQYFRLRAGQTYADPGHIAVTSYPQDWRTLTVELTAPGAASDTEQDGSQLDELREELAAAEEGVERLSHALASVVEVLKNANLLEGVDTDRDGWLADRIAEIVSPAVGIAVPPLDEPHAYQPPGTEERAAIRAWAAETGRRVSDRGALAQSLVETYRRERRNG